MLAGLSVRVFGIAPPAFLFPAWLSQTSPSQTSQPPFRVTLLRLPIYADQKNRPRKRYVTHFFPAFRRLYRICLYYHSSGIVVLWTTTLHSYPLHQDFEFNAT